MIKNNILYQNHTVDIYENYDENDEIVLDYFILEDEIKNQNIENSKLEKFSLCPVCGKILDCNLTNSNKIECEHSNVDKVYLYRVNKDESKIKNNLTSCPICNGKSKKGLIKTISMGKESATALITQIFFEAVDQEENKEEKNENDNKKINILLTKNPKESNKEYKFTKQILSFSDSRQQASFAVKFAESNHHKLLRKRLLFEILKDNEILNFYDSESKLDAIIDKYDLFDSKFGENIVSSTKQAKICLLRELLNVDGIYGGEGLGLYYFKYNPLIDLIKMLDDNAIKEFIAQVDPRITTSFSLEEFKDYLDFFINSFRNIPAIYYDGLTKQDRENYFAYRMFDNHVKLIKVDNIYNSNNEDISKSVYSLISHTNTSNKLEKYTEKIFNIDKELADKLIQNIWNVLIDQKVLFEFDKRNALYSLYADKFLLCRYDMSDWFYCKKCRNLNRINIKNICPYCFENNTLIKSNPNSLLENNYYRNQYMTKKIEKLVYKEHTAQISAEAGKDRQNEFKNKKINYLSCSTTFEMGIDIGSLENVLLRNVPPSPSNYIQRAGRAGRSQESSAFILTYCSPSSHDYTYFENPLRMVEGTCNTPIFSMDNHKIIYRHLLSMSLSDFFRGNKIYFNGVKEFYLEGGFDKFIDYLMSKPENLLNNTNFILNTTNAKELMNGMWIDNILNKIDIDIDISKDRIISILNEIDTTIENMNKDNVELKNSLIRQRKIITEDKDLISKLADGNLIPKYGFPTDLIELRIKDPSINTGNYDLTRDMKIALSEYVPQSEIMVDKKTIVSRYVNKVESLVRSYYYECSNCHKTFVQYSDNLILECDNCNNDEPLVQIGIFLNPKFGFTGEIKNNAGIELKPKRSYSSPVKYIGNGILDGDKIEVNSNMIIYSTKNDEMLIINENPFFTCEKCGYTLIDHENAQLPFIKKKHVGIYSKCNYDKLVKCGFGFTYKTDVLKMVISMHMENYNQAISTLYALLEGISLAFDIERNDIDGIYINEDDKHVFVFFDTVPGGAGHVKRMLDKNELLKAFNYALEKVSQNCCDVACYNCIKNYKNQKYHDFLRRDSAKRFLTNIIGIFNE